MVEELKDGRKLNDFDEWDFDQDFEECLIALAIRSKDIFTKYGHLIKAEYFTTQISRDILTLGIDYIDKYGTEPDKAILKNEVKANHAKYKHRSETIEDYFSAVDRIFDLDLERIAEYALDKVIDFARRRQLKINLTLIGRSVMGKEDDLEQCRGKIEEALDIGKEIEIHKELKLDIELPENVIQGFAKEFAEAYNEHTESPPIFLAFSVLAHLGNIFCKEISLQISFNIEPRLYLVLVGESASTKKSTAFTLVSDFFKEYFELNEPFLLEPNVQVVERRNLRSDEQQIIDRRENAEIYCRELEEIWEFKQDGERRLNRKNYYRRVDENGKPLPSIFYHRCDGVGSAEGLMIDLQRAPKLMLFYDEMKSFVSKCESRESNLLSKVNELFQKTSIENRTKTGKIQHVRDAHLSFFGCATTDTFQQMFSTAFADIGFMNRLWIVMADSDKVIPYPPPVTFQKKYRLMRKFNEIAKTFPHKSMTLIELDQEAHKRWEDWYINLERDETTKRLDTNLGFKMMMLMAINECKTVVDLDMMERVIQLLEYQRKVRQLSKPIEATSHVAVLENLIRKALLKHGELTGRELKQFTNATRYKTFDFQHALESMEKIGEIGKRRKGRTDVYRLLDNLQIIKKWEKPEM